MHSSHVVCRLQARGCMKTLSSLLKRCRINWLIVKRRSAVFLIKPSYHKAYNSKNEHSLFLQGTGSLPMGPEVTLVNLTDTNFKVISFNE